MKPLRKQKRVWNQIQSSIWILRSMRARKFILNKLDDEVWLKLNPHVFLSTGHKIATNIIRLIYDK